MKHFVLLVCCTVVSFGMMPLLAFAQDAANEREQPLQELFQTGLVYPQERGEVQLTYSTRFSKGNGRTLWRSPLMLEYGITARWQVEIEFDLRSSRSETGEPKTRGTGDLSIGTQYSFMNLRSSNFHSAVGLEVTLPTGSVEKELSEGFIEYEPYFIAAKDFPRFNNMQVFSQVGLGLVQRVRSSVGVDEEEPAAHKLTLSAGMFMPFRRVVLTGEVNLSTNRWNHGGLERELYATPGAVWRLLHNWEIGVGVPFGLTRDTNRFGAIFKTTFEFGTIAHETASTDRSKLGSH
jgi:hypothetical protein